MGLPDDGALLAANLAKRIGVTVWSSADVAGLTPAEVLSLVDGWSAFTLRANERHLVVFNQHQNRERTNSVVMHELSHIILGHELATASLTSDGQLVPNNYDQDQEDEADWLAGTMLLPRPALLALTRARLSDTEATQRYVVSLDMLTWRLRMTGVDYQIASYQRKRAG